MSESLQFTNTHEWLSQNNDEVTVGITAHAQDLLGDMVFVELPTIGHEVKAGEEIGVLESVKAASDFYAPISGRIIAINESVNSNPELINSDPYGAGWLVKIKASQPHELDSLLNKDQYQATLKN